MGALEWLDRIFGQWFKNITLLISLIAGVILLFFSFRNGWIGKDFAVELIFFLMGIFIGLWIEKKGEHKDGSN